MSHKSGFVSIIGKPNTGKSTLLNALMGENLSVTASKAQTTRHRIKGILTGKNYQVIFSDTPGIIKPAYKLQEKMMEAVEETFEDADVILLVTDPFDFKMDAAAVEKLKSSKAPVIAVINKKDAAQKELMEKMKKYVSGQLPSAEIISVSALKKDNIDILLTKIIELLPENPPYFDHESLSDRNERFFVTEIIRQKILENYSKEIPYSVEVAIDEYREKKEPYFIRAVIYTERESQKAILLGHKGNAIKKVGTEARIDIEKLIGKKIYLELVVKVNENWRNSEAALKRFGY